MGYTHYWNITRAVTPDEMTALAADARKIIAISGVSIRGWDGNLDAMLGPDAISFNGDASLDESGETFAIDENPRSDWCKTGRRPYDTVVVACLLAAKDRLEQYIQLSSDGTNADWKAGRALAVRALGRPVPYASDVLRPSKEWAS
jgi:hypothetical protein